MEGVNERGFDIQKSTERKPFGSDQAKSLLNAWCEAHDGIRPKFLEREKWDEKKGQILEERADGLKDLVLPQDIQLWELLDVAEKIDSDSFASGKRIYKGIERSKRFQEIGKTFENAAIYMANRIDDIKEGKEIAKEMIEGLYSYGKSLQGRDEYSGEVKIDELAKNKLSETETEKMDKWLAGDAYELVKGRVGDDKEQQEKLRGEMLSKYFKLSEIVLKREEENINNKDGDEWEKSPSRVLLEKIRNRQSEAINMPEKELDKAIFDRGMETLMNGMMSRIDGEVNRSKILVHEMLDIQSFKEQIEKAKKDWQEETDKTKKEEKMDFLANLEDEIATTIQSEVSKLKYSTLFKPSEIVANQELNCVGFSMLAGALFDEVGLKYVSASKPGHSILMLVTADNHMKWVEVQNVGMNRWLSDVDVNGTDEKVEDISRKIYEGNFNKGKFRVKLNKPDWGYKEPEGAKDMYVSFSAGNTELSAQAWNWIGRKYSLDNKMEESRLAFKKTISLNENYLIAYRNLEVVTDDYEEKQNLLRKVIELDESFAEAYFALAKLSFSSEEKIKLFRKAIEKDEKYTEAYNSLAVATDDIAEKERCYRKVIELAPEHPNAYFKLAKIVTDEKEKERLLLKNIEYDETNADAYLLLGNLSTDQVKKEKYYRKLTELAPDYALGYYYLSFQVEDEKEKAELLRKAININNTYVNAYSELAEVSTNIEEKKNCYREMIKLVPDFAPSYLKLANITNNLDEQKKCYGELIKLAPHFSLPYVRLGLINPNLEEKEQLFLKAIKVDRLYAPPYYFLAKMAERKGDFLEAANYYKSYVTFESRESEKELVDSVKKHLEEMAKL